MSNAVDYRPTGPAKSAERTRYSPEFYGHVSNTARRSAEQVVPVLMQLLKPRSVIDVGCGLGSWLSVFSENGVDDILGVDGEDVDTTRLEIPTERFVRHDLRRPLRLNQRSDLVLCLEVAEHLPLECAERLVDSVTCLGPIILFSAAIPFQGGMGHLNEQWPAYWIDHFAQRGFVAVDCIRKRFWTNEHVAWWYAQNALLFVKQSRLEEDAALKQEFKSSFPSFIPAIHPLLYLQANQTHSVSNERCLTNLGLRTLLALLPMLVVRAAQRRVRSLAIKRVPESS